MTPVSPSNPFEESTNPFESESTADARSSSQPQVEVSALATLMMCVFALDQCCVTRS